MKSRLYFQGEWFDELDPSALAEAEFESILSQQSDLLSPDCWVVPFKKTVYAEGSSGRADLALIHKDYRRWYVVEVELIQHSLNGHVIPQINVFRNANYGPAEAEYIAQKHTEIKVGRLREMMLGEPPRVLVIVNKPDSEWGSALRRYDAKLIVFEIFRSNKNKHIFKVDGELPRLAADALTDCKVDPVLPRFLKIASPAALDFGTGKIITIVVGEKLTDWERINTADQCYLAPLGRMLLQKGLQYILLKIEDGRYQIIEGG